MVFSQCPQATHSPANHVSHTAKPHSQLCLEGKVFSQNTLESKMVTKSAGVGWWQSHNPQYKTKGLYTGSHRWVILDHFTVKNICAISWVTTVWSPILLNISLAAWERAIEGKQIHGKNTDWVFRVLYWSLPFLWGKVFLYQIFVKVVCNNQTQKTSQWKSPSCQVPNLQENVFCLLLDAS